ncbi:MAG: anhydro-N-acetylmuramic acid kinase [Idiomarina sp.]|nr:anhydro-N-acetylmuramic acid kinase [Idiomarina sp.]
MEATYYIGLMSGTSLDGLDIVVCQFDNDGRPQVTSSTTVSLPDPLRSQLWQLTQPGGAELDQYGSLDRQFAIFCSDAIVQHLQAQGIDAQHVIAIGSHGQTVRHRPQSEPAFTLQLGCASTMAALTGIDVIANFRQKDIALGGEGAPLAPAFHRAQFFQRGTQRAIVNIGGIANLTLFDANGEMTGFDSGPGNCLMDSWYRLHHPQATHEYDHNAGWASLGQVNQGLLEDCLADAYFQRQGPRSTGREYFHLPWLQAKLAGSAIAPVDVQRTLLELTARSIAEAISIQPDACFLCGGGVHNPLLHARLQQLLAGTDVQSSAKLGIDPDAVEALAFAWLAWCFVNRRPVDLRAVTGAQRKTILGGLFLAA